MKKWIMVVAVVLAFTQLRAYSETEPACPGTCTPVCPPIYAPILNTETVVVSDPTMGLLSNTVWGQCNVNSCCGSGQTCVLQFGQRSVLVGIWVGSSAISIAPNLPQGFGLGSGNLVTLNGSTTKTIGGQTIHACTLDACEQSSYKVGPGYTRVTKTQEVYKVCTKKNAAGSCQFLQAINCELYIYQAEVFAKYLSPEVLVEGTCGIPWSGCAQCVNPASPTC